MALDDEPYDARMLRALIGQIAEHGGSTPAPTRLIAARRGTSPRQAKGAGDG